MTHSMEVRYPVLYHEFNLIIWDSHCWQDWAVNSRTFLFSLALVLKSNLRDFRVITSSILNGPLVLRHELGHSIIDVGEEYDGGNAYLGVNAAHSANKPIPWNHWLSNVPSAKDTEVQDGLNTPMESVISEYRTERSVMPVQAYPWTLLNTTRAWSINFTSSGAYSRHLVRFSLSGIPEAQDLRIDLDGNDLKWAPKEGLGLDRWHYDIHRNLSLSSGEHELKFTLLKKELAGVAQICSTEIIEFGNEQEYVSIFPEALNSHIV